MNCTGVFGGEKLKSLKGREEKGGFHVEEFRKVGILFQDLISIDTGHDFSYGGKSGPLIGVWEFMAVYGM